jgi:hypothetical protein
VPEKLAAEACPAVKASAVNDSANTSIDANTISAWFLLIVSTI